jgi:hypothetical protein
MPDCEELEDAVPFCAGAQLSIPFIIPDIHDSTLTLKLKPSLFKQSWS